MTSGSGGSGGGGEHPWFLPDVDAAEGREHQPQGERQGHGQQGGQQPVEDEPEQLEGCVAADPHSVEAVRGAGLREDVFKIDLFGHKHTVR